MKNKAQAAIEVATGRIVVREPFFASILLGIELIDDPGIPTFCTNGVNIRYNPDFAASLDEEELIGVLCHEVEHIAKLHPWRRGDRDPRGWNIATDLSINEELSSAGFRLPKDGLRNSACHGMAEEQIYAALLQMQGPVYPWSFGEVQDCPGTQAEKTLIENGVKVEVMRAALIAKQQGRLPASMVSWVEELKHPKVSWREVFRNYLTAFGREDYTWLRPNRRYMDTGFSLPSLHRYRCGTVAIAIDTSGSICQMELDQFIGELRDILESVQPERTIFIQCDCKVFDYRVFSSGETLDDQVKLCGGGDTAFAPVFDRIEQEGETPEVLVYLTDAYGPFPNQPPVYPVLWVVTSCAKPPWGDRIEIPASELPITRHPTHL